MGRNKKDDLCLYLQNDILKIKNTSGRKSGKPASLLLLQKMLLEGKKACPVQK